MFLVVFFNNIDWKIGNFIWNNNVSALYPTCIIFSDRWFRRHYLHQKPCKSGSWLWVASPCADVIVSYLVPVLTLMPVSVSFSVGFLWLMVIYITSVITTTSCYCSGPSLWWDFVAHQYFLLPRVCWACVVNIHSYRDKQHYVLRIPSPKSLQILKLVLWLKFKSPGWCYSILSYMH